MIYVLIAAIALLVGWNIYLQIRLKRSEQRSKTTVADLTAKIHKLEESHEKEIIREAIALFEREMQQMGADLHDDLVQKLAGFRLFMDRIDRAVTRSEVEAIMVKMNSEFTQVVDSVRRISRRLLPEGIEAGSLNGALNELCNRIGPGRMAHLHFSVQGIERSLPQDYQLHLYRIVQELLNNIIKHTVAWHIWVKVFWKRKTVEIQVEDDGMHYERLANAMERQGKGFLTLQKRATLIGAKVSYEPAEKGTRATVSLNF